MCSVRSVFQTRKFRSVAARIQAGLVSNSSARSELRGLCVLCDGRTSCSLWFNSTNSIAQRRSRKLAVPTGTVDGSRTGFVGVGGRCLNHGEHREHGASHLESVFFGSRNAARFRLIAMA